MSQITKTCTHCHTTKPTDDFYRKTNGLHGVESRCKECRKEYRRYMYHHGTSKHEEECQRDTLQAWNKMKANKAKQQKLDKLLS